MIVLDTHIWVWWVHDAPELLPIYRAAVERHEAAGLGVSAIACWEVAKLVELERLTLPISVEVWLDWALAEPGIRLLPLTPQIEKPEDQRCDHHHAIRRVAPQSAHCSTKPATGPHYLHLARASA